MNQKEADQIISKIRKNYPIDHPLTEKELIAFVQSLVKKKAILPTEKVSVEYYTPRWLIELVNEVIEGEHINLDPASNEIANRVVDAEVFYTQEQNGIDKNWDYKIIYCNPPYGIDREGFYGDHKGTPVAKYWLSKAIFEYRNNIYNTGIDCLFMLVNRTGAKWYQKIKPEFDLVCEFESRIAFDVITPEGNREPMKSPVYCNDLLFLGTKEYQTRFKQVFNRDSIGRVMECK